VLVPIRTGGAKPPLFFVHGLDGVMPFGRSLMRALAPDRPLYALNARGLDGQQPPSQAVQEMADDYLREVRQVQPTGPYILGGICAGAMAALEMARNLLAMDEAVAPVLMVDPPGVPPGFNEQHQALKSGLSPRIHQQLYRSALESLRRSALRDGGLPFDVGDPQRLHVAATAGVTTMVAFSRHRPAPFHGATECFLSEERAPAHFNPALPWRGLLQGPRVIHVLPGSHDSLFDPTRGDLWRMIGFSVECLTESAASADA
jgi:thioesterase domain-containing protein